MAVRLDTLDDDTLIYVFAFLAVPEILSIRQVTSRFQDLLLTIINNPFTDVLADIQAL